MNIITVIIKSTNFTKIQNFKQITIYKLHKTKFGILAFCRVWLSRVACDFVWHFVALCFWNF